MEAMKYHGMKSQAGAWRSGEEDMPHARAETPLSRKGTKKRKELGPRMGANFR